MGPPLEKRYERREKGKGKRGKSASSFSCVIAAMATQPCEDHVSLQPVHAYGYSVPSVAETVLAMYSVKLYSHHIIIKI